MQNCVSTSMQFFDNNCLSHHNCVSRTPVLRKKKTTVLHKTVVFHITVVWFQVCLKQDMQKHLWFTHVKKTFLHTSRVPLLNWRRPEMCKTKQNSSTATHISSRNHATCRSNKKKTFVWFWLFYATCKKKTNMLRGPFVQHELRPKWPLPVLCYTHRLLSS